MDCYDIFNGDADGIIALHLWRMQNPKETTLISGVKRDIALLQQVPLRKNLQLAVFDISLKANLSFLMPILEKQSKILWFDHHQPGILHPTPSLSLHIDQSPETCTCNIIHTEIGGRFSKWAAAAAFGDNLDKLGQTLSSKSGCTEEDIGRLKDLGQLLNYNAYGESLKDLHCNPITVYQNLKNYEDPLSFYEQSDLIKKLQSGFHEDLAKTTEATIEDFKEKGAAVYLPDEKWARRVIGTFANRLSCTNPERPHAILLKKEKGWMVSVRAPENNPIGAESLCSQFPTGGGRNKAAGINFLSDDALSRFLDRFTHHFT